MNILNFQNHLTILKILKVLQSLVNRGIDKREENQINEIVNENS